MSCLDGGAVTGWIDGDDGDRATAYAPAMPATKDRLVHPWGRLPR